MSVVRDQLDLEEGDFFPRTSCMNSSVLFRSLSLLPCFAILWSLPYCCSPEKEMFPLRSVETERQFLTSAVHDNEQ